MTGHPHTDDDEVDVPMPRHVTEPAERLLGTKRRGGGLGRVRVRGADGLQLVVGQSLQGGNVGIGPPAAAPLGHGRSHDAYANLVGHQRTAGVSML